jgi:hypothetical protein
MSSLAFPPAALPARPARWSLSDVLARRGMDVLLVVVVLGFATALLGFLPGSFNVDSWLELVTGREIWQSGIPHHELLTSMSHGTTWIDQQWLGQLVSYGLYRLGGLGLLGVVNMALMTLSVGGGVIAARKLGAPARAMLLVLPLCLVLIAPSHEVRTQAFAMPLFVATAYLLVADCRAPSRRVYWCFPILVLWANLHGSVALGALLVAMRGATVAWERRSVLLSSPRQWVRPLLLVGGASVCLLITPYGASIISYYHTMFLGSSVMHAVSEWQPITSASVTAIPFFITAAILTWCLGRNSSRATLFDQLALLVLAVCSIEVIRNVLFFALFALIVMPLVLGVKPREDTGTGVQRRVAINGLLLGLALFATLIGTAAALLRPASTIEFHYQRMGVLTAVERVERADPSVKVLTDVRFSDWLLWRDPSLTGRVASDARWELLTPKQMTAIQNVFNVTGTDWTAGAQGYRLVVLDRKYDPAAIQAFVREPGSRILYDDGERVVILRSAREAG